MKRRIDTEDLYRQKEQSRKLRARRPIAEKLKIAEELRDLQKALAPAREANRLKIQKEQSSTRPDKPAASTE